MAAELEHLGSAFRAGAVSLLVAGASAPFVLRALKQMKSRQSIQKELEEHKAKEGTPTMGGIIILLGLAAGLAAGWEPVLAGPAALLAGFGLVGFLDDYLMPKLKPGSRGLDWKPKLALEIAAGVLAFVLSGVSDPASIGIGLFFVLFFSNAYNFSDGLDGLAGGLGVILCGGIAALALPMGGASGPILVLCAALGLAFLPFLGINAAPARVFMGDVGALPIGALLGWMIVRLGSQGEGLPLLWPLAVLSLVMAAELIPVPLQVGSAKLRKGKRLFPFKTPIHHGFQSAGWPETRVVAMFHLVQLGLVFLSLALAFLMGWF